MGFSTQHTRQGRQYAPHTRNVMNNSSSVQQFFNTMASFNSGNSLLSHIRSWQRSRRLRSLGKNAVVNPMNNLCYQSMMPKSAADKSPHMSAPGMLGFHADTSTSPVVRFRNNGDEDAIAMQLVNRVMLNENQLYSMHHSGKGTLAAKASACDHLQQGLSDNCYVSLEAPQETTLSKHDPMNKEIWYYGNLERERAVQLVSRSFTGSFLVRSSSTFKHSYALTVKVPLDHSHTGVCHYLIIRTDEGKFKIKGFAKEFQTVQSLIVHHTIMREMLPCTLKLQTTKSFSCSQLGYNTVNRTNGPVYGTHCGNFYTYGKSCGALNEPDAEDLMVDVDDPTYQKIVDMLKVAMAQCS